MWRSTDGGTTWARRPLVANGFSNFMAVDPQNPKTLYVGTWPGVAKSADGGDTWTVASFGPPQFFFVQSLAIDPQSPNVLYATIYLPYPIFQSAVFKSIDSGSTWIPFSNGLSDLNIGTLAIASHGPNILYAGTSQGLFRITDDTPVISLDATQYCTGNSWKLNVSNGVTNASMGIQGTSNGVSWDIRDWRKTDADGNWRETGEFAPGTEGRHFLGVDIGGVLSNIASLVVSNCAP